MTPGTAGLSSTSVVLKDDSDNPYGGVFTDARYARRYFTLNDSTRSTLFCSGIFAESVLALDFDRLATKEGTPS